MFSRVLLSIAAVAASVGLVLYGMGSSYSPKDDGMERWGLILLAVGVIGILIGIVLYRQSEAALEAEAVRNYGPDPY